MVIGSLARPLFTEQALRERSKKGLGLDYPEESRWESI